MPLSQHLAALEGAPFDMAAFAGLSQDDRWTYFRALDRACRDLDTRDAVAAARSVEGRPQPEFDLGDHVEGPFVGLCEVVDMHWWNHSQCWSYALWSLVSKAPLQGSFYSDSRRPPYYQADIIRAVATPVLEKSA